MAVLTAVILVLLSCPYSALADGETPDGKSGTWCNGTWRIENNSVLGAVLTVSGIGSMDSVEIEDNADNGMTFAELINERDVRAVCFNEGVTSIADNFVYTNSETRSPVRVLSLPRTMLSIGQNAFRNSCLRQVLPKTYYATIYESQNANLISLMGMFKLSLFSENINYIGPYAFADTTDFYTDSVMLPKHLETVEEGIFYNSTLNSVTSFTTIKSFGKKAFANCPNLQQIYAPVTLEAIYEDPDRPQDNAFGYRDNGAKNNSKINDALPEGVTVLCEEDSLGYDYAQRHGFNIQVGNTGCYDSGEVSAEGAENVLGYQYFIESGLVTLVCGQRLYSTIMQARYFTGEYDPKEEFAAASRPDQAVVSNRVDYYAGVSADFDVTIFFYGGNIEYQSEPVEPGFFNTKVVELKEGIKKLQVSNTFEAFDPELIILPNTLEYLDYDVFGNCNKLKSIVIPDSVTYIGSKVFVNCPSLEGVDLGNGITVVPSKLFYNCKSLCYVNIGENVNTISDLAFSNCTALESIDIPDSVVTIGRESFNNCISAISLDLGTGVSSIGSGAFSDCLYCETVNVKSNLSSDNCSNAFNGTGDYTNGVELTFGNDVTDVDFEVFKGAKITKVVLGKNVRNVTGVQYLDSLKEIEVDSENPYFYTENKLLYSSSNVLTLVPQTLENYEIKSSAAAIGDFACYNTAALGVKVPASVRAIGNHAFEESKSLRSLSLSNGLLSIGNSAFKNCKKLRVLFLPDSVTTLGDNSFSGCERLTAVILNESLSNIGEKAFYECTSIRGIVLPESVASVGDFALAECSSLEYAYIWRTTLGENVFFNDPLIRIYTIAGAPAWAYAREYNIPYTGYTDEDLFFVDAGLKRDEEAGYIGICDGEHGDIEWLTIYDADCENEGYMIGVCEYCSQVLEERTIAPLGHSFILSSSVPPTDNQRGVNTYQCTRCMAVTAEYLSPLNGQSEPEDVYSITGRIVIADDVTAQSGMNPARNAAIQLDGVTVARTNTNGTFSLEVNSGVDCIRIHYAFGFDRYITVAVEEESVNLGDIPIIGCDFNRDGVLSEKDEELFAYILSSEPDDPSYMSYADINNDGYINAKDFAIVHNCMGINKNTYVYEELVFN